MAYSADVNPGDDILASHYNNLRKDAVPDGAIIMWSGLLASIPTGWHLCDGTSGTPDLREKFVRGAPAATEAGGTGGEDTHILTEAEMPSHNHDIPVAAVGVGNVAAKGTGTYDLIDTGLKGSGNAHENRPAYYQILYIMKIS